MVEKLRFGPPLTHDEKQQFRTTLRRKWTMATAELSDCEEKGREVLDFETDGLEQSSTDSDSLGPRFIPVFDCFLCCVCHYNNNTITPYNNGNNT